jgi:hypothetical protein
LGLTIQNQVTFVKPKRGIDARLMRKNVFTKMHTMDIHEPRSRNIAVWLGKVTCSQIWFQRFGRRIKKSLKTSVTGQSRRFTQKVKPKKKQRNDKSGRRFEGTKPSNVWGNHFNGSQQATNEL